MTSQREILSYNTELTDRLLINKAKWEEKDLFIYFIPPYSPELNKIEILWRFIKYQWLGFDAYTNFQKLKESVETIIKKVGTEYCINFY